MSLADVKNAIHAGVQAEADAVIAQARRDGAQIVTNARTAIAERRVAFDVETERIKESFERKELAAANTARKAILLRAKRDAIDEAFTEFSTALDALPAQEHAKILVALAKRAKEELGTVSRIRCNAKDVQSYATQFPQATILADASVHGGLNAQNQTGTVSIDLTYSSIINQMREDELTSLANILFDRHGVH